MNYIGEELERLLARVEKPARYIGGELHSVIKDPKTVDTRFGFVFPDTYEIGMSYLGMQILYHALNAEEFIFCERFFAPGMDMEKEMRKAGIPFFSIETKTPAKEMDILGFTLQYEMCYTNVINLLDLSGIPLRSKDRGEGVPFISAGGPCAFNPEPLAEFIDFFVIGDGEEVNIELCRIHKEWKATGGSRRAFLEEICKLEGIYVPAFYEPVYGEDGAFIRMDKLYKAAPDRISKRVVQDLDTAPFPEKPIVPLIEVVHDRAVVEIFRGCTRGCRFCQAGMIYRPVRERSKERIEALVRAQLEASGYDELSLLSLSTSDYSEIEPLVTDLMITCRQKNVALSLPSLRLDSFSFHVLDEIQSYRKSSLTFAPEAGTQRLRNVINKSITEEDIYSSMKQAIQLGWINIKLYFMVGLPTETYADLDGIVEIAKNIMNLYYEHNGGRKNARFNITVSVSNFVPKPHTPFQWFPQNTREQLRKKHNYLKEKFRTVRGVHFTYHDTETSYMEAVLARGDRRVAAAILRAWELGSKFDGWREHFDYGRWMQAFSEAGLAPECYAYAGDPENGAVCWQIIDSGISDSYFRREWKLAMEETITPDCRKGCTGCGINRTVVCEREGTL